MSISFISASISDDLTRNVGPKPIGTAEGDFMLAHVWAYEEDIVSAPVGWEGPENAAGGPTNDVTGEPEAFFHNIYSKFAGTIEPDDYTFVITTDTGPDPNRRVVIASYRGVHPDAGATHPIAGVSDGHTENAGSDTLEIFGISGAPAGQRVVVMAAVGTTSPTATMPSPYIERLDQEGNFVFDYQVTGDPVDNPLVTFPSPMTSWGHAIRLNAAPEEPGNRFDCSGIDSQIN